MTVEPIFAWYDFWIGLFWDGAKRRLYFFPVPCFGLVFKFAPRLPIDTGALPRDLRNWERGE